MKKIFAWSFLMIFVATINLVSLPEIKACTRVVYQGPNQIIITARSMDWIGEIPANLWIFPRGMERQGVAGPNNSVKWKSKYGSLIATAWDIATADGINEKGLVANLLWLEESEYPKFDINGNIKGLSIAAWAQYVLDNFATVDEAVNELRKEEFVIVSTNIPGTEKFTTLHLSISDATGDNAIFEYLGGKLYIHHDRSYQVMTNSPPFEQQLAINKYWQSIPGTIMIPGTNRSADRFARAAYYIHAIPQFDNTPEAIASVFSVIRNCSVPFGISTEDAPNISSTRWRSVADQKNLVYYFETALTPNTFWVDLKNIDFSEKAKVKKLSVANNESYVGDAVNSFKDALPFKFEGL
jgi:penicillin V acylase-like amidase (Ntn superfamily)